MFEACTRPELVKRWWGPFDSKVVVCDIDLRVGGSWRYLLRFPDGREVGFRGAYREIVRDERIVQTWIYDPYPTSEAIETVTFADQGAGTLVTIHGAYPSVEVRDEVVKSGMERGVQDTHRQLDELVRSLARAA